MSQITILRQSRGSKQLNRLPDSPLLALDKWALPYKSIDHRTSVRVAGASRFTQHVLDGHHERAWHAIEPQIERDVRFLDNFRPSTCTKFLSLLPAGSVDGQDSWPRALKFAEAMRKAGIPLNSKDYTHLINLSFKARDYRAVNDLWDQVETLHPELLADVNLWNAYIQAACQAYPLFWPTGKPPARLRPEETPPLAADIVDLLRKMELMGVSYNARTYELIMLAYARRGELSVSQGIAQEVWMANDLARGSSLYPSTSTLTAIIHAYGYNGKLPEGIQAMLEVQRKYAIPLDSADAIHTWIRTLRLAKVNTQPSGAYPAKLFDQIWQLATQQHGVRPNLGMWSVRIEHLIAKNKFEQVVADIPLILETKLPGYLDESRRRAVAESALRRVVEGYTNTGRALDALALLDTWAKRGVDLRVEMQEYVKRRSGMTFEQLAMFKEDDDGDWM